MILTATNTGRVMRRIRFDKMRDTCTSALAAFISMMMLDCCLAQPQQSSSAGLLRITRDQLCVTNGTVIGDGDGRLIVETPSSRAIVSGGTGQVAEIKFRYLGPTVGSKPLTSGELRRQIGLKLKAQDSCNLLYAMWHIEPHTGLAVTIKRNPGMHAHTQCGARGYVPVKGETTWKLPTLAPGEVHRLHAELQGDRLSLLADGELAWQGSVGPLVSEFDGPVGLRTDNGRFELEFFSKPNDGAAGGSKKSKACRTESSE